MTKEALGACIDFGYLGDDDDSDDSGGAGPALFDAIPTASSPFNVGATETITVTTSFGGGSPQTNGTFPVLISSRYTGGIGGTGSLAHLVAAPTTTGLAGWSQTGWSYSSFLELWSNTFTKASVTASNAITIDIVTDLPGTVNVYTNTGGSVMTDQASGAGAHIALTSSAPATFDVTLSCPSEGLGPFDPGHAVYSSPLVITAAAVAGGVSQTSGSFYMRIYDNYGFNVISGVATTNAAGWSETGWSLSVGVWSNHYTKASVAIGTTNPEVTVSCGLNTGWVYAETTAGVAAPQTAEATGVGDTCSVHLFSS